MRFYIKAYPMHEDEVSAVKGEVDAGSVEAVVQDGLIDGIADDAAIQRLADRGIVVQVIAEFIDRGPAAPETPPESGDTFAAESAGVGAAPADRRARARSRRAASVEYWLATLLSGLVDRVMAQLADAGAEIVERDPSGDFVLRTVNGAGALRALPFISNVRPYGTRETIEGAISAIAEASGAGSEGVAITRAIAGRRSRAMARSAEGRSQEPAAGRFEAICHRAEDLDQVRDQIAALGATIVSGRGRIVRFILNRNDVEAVAALSGVASVGASNPPRLLADKARAIIALDQPGPAPISMSYDGSGELVGVADTGLDRQHPDFASKQVTVVALGRQNDGSDPDGHGTHVAGIAVGDGAASGGAIRGIASAADLYFQSVLDINGGLGGLPDSLNQLFQPAYDAGVRVHNNSWGAYLQSRYESMALDVDDFVFKHPDFLPLIAAGNEGSCLPGIAAKRGFVDYPSLGAPATAKNGLTVGASRSDRTTGGLAALSWHDAWPEDFADAPIAGETVSGDRQSLAAFSSRGPCDDMRIKPDVVAPGTDIASTRSKDARLANFWGAYPNNRHYAFMGGTSMACPVVAGCAALVRQYYREQHSGHAPSAALLKATLINGTRPLMGADATADPPGDPNYHQGFGLIDMSLTLPDKSQPQLDLFFVDTWNRDAAMRMASRTARRRWVFNVTRPGELRIALVWTDYPGRALQNRLRSVLDTRDQNGVVTNWIGNARATVPVKIPVHDPRHVLPGHTNVVTTDPHNNVQVIRAQIAPGSYTLAVFADMLIHLPQDFALVATFPAGGATMQVY